MENLVLPNTAGGSNRQLPKAVSGRHVPSSMVLYGDQTRTIALMRAKPVWLFLSEAKQVVPENRPHQPKGFQGEPHKKKETSSWQCFTDFVQRDHISHEIMQ